MKYTIQNYSLRYLLILIVLILTACKAEDKNEKITYRVSGTANAASLTYTNAQGGTEQTTVDLPWEITMNMPKDEFKYISAQNEGNGSIICEILINDNPYKSSTSNGEFAIATASD